MVIIGDFRWDKNLDALICLNGPFAMTFKYQQFGKQFYIFRGKRKIKMRNRLLSDRRYFLCDMIELTICYVNAKICMHDVLNKYWFLMKSV